MGTEDSPWHMRGERRRWGGELGKCIVRRTVIIQSALFIPLLTCISIALGRSLDQFIEEQP
ncbi:MAG TPA: hypothetical protein VMT12_17425 [Syntrophales bacterium]|nr:hypothetical protein [Syntrophales bacterium]